MLANQLISEIRHFNRFYTNHFGMLNKKYLGTEYAIIEGRILFELALGEVKTSKEIINYLDIDQGYLSRILSRFEKSGLIERKSSKKDAREKFLTLTKKGKAVIDDLTIKANLQISNLVENLSLDKQQQLYSSIKNIEQLLQNDNSSVPVFYIRGFKTGDIGYLTYCQAKLYENENGYNEILEAYIAGTMSQFILNFNKRKENLWVVEKDKEIVGSIAIVMVSEEIAQLRWLFVDASLRRMKMGYKLVNDAIEFCKDKNYKKIILWTGDKQVVAKKMYAKFNFKLIDTKENSTWGEKLIEECWELIIG